MRNVYVTFGGLAYDPTLSKIAADGQKFGADEVWIYDDAWLEKTDFRQIHRALWDHPGFHGVKHGYGWYCWKPYVILHAMSRLMYGDVLLYTDGDTYPVADFSKLFDYCRDAGGAFLFQATGCTNRQYVKRDCFEIIDPLQEVLIDSLHATGRFALFEKTGASLDFLLNWLRFVTDPRCPTRDPSVLAPEYEGFEENRGDQSVLSMLAHLANIPLHREADAFGNHVREDWDIYPQLFEQVYCHGDRQDTSGSIYANVSAELNLRPRR